MTLTACHRFSGCDVCMAAITWVDLYIVSFGLGDRSRSVAVDKDGEYCRTFMESTVELFNYNEL